MDNVNTIDYEKKYKDALEIAKSFDLPEYKNIMASVFPELKESEDERIRKEIIEILKNENIEFPSSTIGAKAASWIAWLEKQGEYLENYDEAEKEKADFVGDGFIECHADFLDFKEGNTYWLEYIGDDKYNVRSDNLFCKTYHITPCQLYTVFKKLTWLEKQGKQETLCDICRKYHPSLSCQDITELGRCAVEPKFHEGDWIRHQGTENIYQVVSIIDNKYRLKYIDNYTVQECADVDRCARLWDITKDAKDGDVLATSEGAFIYNGNNGGGSCPGSYCGINTLGGFQTGVEHHWTVKSVFPATKEQRDALMKAMNDAGYEWDSEKKELREGEKVE